MKKKHFNQSIDIKYLKEINDILSDNYAVFAHASFYKSDKNQKKKKLKYFNLLCTCIIRIRETNYYLSDFEFKQHNIFGQAFDFYEFINCSSVIFNCVESILEIFGLNLKNYYIKKNCFKKSNKTAVNDYKFFKFIRSAAVAHPDNTTAYKKIVKRKNEIYPYAVWKDSVLDFFLTGADVESDVALLSWASSLKSKYKRYYLYIDEFYDFLRYTINTLSDVIPIMQNKIFTYKNNHKCLRLKKPIDFKRYSSYLMYLAKRIEKLSLNKSDYPDGGLLIAADIINNNLISSAFKHYVKKRVYLLRNMMLNDCSSIDYETIFEELDLYSFIVGRVTDPNYVAEKFDSYLRAKARYEIKYENKSKYISDYIKYKDDPASGSDAFWAVYKLFSCDLFLKKFKSYPDYMNLSYTDIYEISLELIFFETIMKSNK